MHSQALGFWLSASIDFSAYTSEEMDLMEIAKCHHNFLFKR